MFSPPPVFCGVHMPCSLTHGESGYLFPSLSLGLWPHTQFESWFALAVISTGHAGITTSLDSGPNRGIRKLTYLLLWFPQMAPMHQMFSTIAHWLSGFEISGAWW